ncbi:AAA family ATPase (plasmid) [Lactococcus garvieae]|uniref:ParA family protein n=1 Tax=Lactococcus garvieae TaxID=1363 RepID=UPI001A90F061|nr:AAA family ATPase [Lactococcus garvieae]MCO7130273.1 AAA family ATPase [Lactococcus garvieae]QSQ99359.1 AAA family ATPase [Lactococcus garvieae]
MARKTSFVNFKGGVAKSTDSQFTASGLAELGYRVLLIDLDQQQNTTYTLMPDGILNIENSIYDVFMQKKNIKDTIYTVGNIDFIPSVPDMMQIDFELQGKPDQPYRLAEALKEIEDQYDFIILDTPPASPTIIMNALTASDDCIIPVKADSYSLNGIGLLSNSIKPVQKYTNKNLKIAGFLLGFYDSRLLLSKGIREQLDELTSIFDTKIFNQSIRNAVALAEAQAMKKSIFEYAPTANVTNDIRKFIEEYLEG